MKKIYLKNYEEYIELEDKDGAEVERIFFDQNIPKDYPIRIKQFVGTKGEIRRIFTEQTKKTDFTADDIQKNREYANERANFARMTPEQKADGRYGYFRLIHKTATGKEITELDFKPAKERMVKFFTDNPKRIYPDLNIFKEVIRIQEWPVKQFNEFKPFSAVVPASILSMLVQCEAEDLKMVRMGLQAN